MFNNLEVFRMARAMALHSGARQSVIARNLANADTPGYAAKDIKPFSAVYESGRDNLVLEATRAGHITGSNSGPAFREVVLEDQATDPNGNSVSLETEMLKAVNVKRQHDKALAVYRSTLNVLRLAVGRG